MANMLDTPILGRGIEKVNMLLFSPDLHSILEGLPHVKYAFFQL